MSILSHEDTAQPSQMSGHLAHRAGPDGQEDIGKRALTVLWAASPLLTQGLSTGPMMIHAAAKKRSKSLGLASVFYAAASVLLVVTGLDESTDGVDPINSICLLINALIGTAHAVKIRRWVWDLPPGTLNERQQAVLAQRNDEREARRGALAIVYEDPRLALQLQIGRIDLDQRAFPDGGLIDINNIPENAIARVLGLPDAVAAKIAQARAVNGGFVSAADLSVTMDLPPRQLDAVAERLIFLPRASDP